MANDLKTTILTLLNREPTIEFGYFDLAAYPRAEVDTLERARILIRSGDARWVRCPHCSESHDVENVMLPGDLTPSLFYDCPDAGREALSPEQVQKWTTTNDSLCDALARLIGASRLRQPVIGDFLIPVATARIGGAPTMIFLARGLDTPAGAHYLEQANVQDAARGGIVLALSQVAPVSLFQRAAGVLSLHDMLSIAQGTLALDIAWIETATEGRSMSRIQTPVAEEEFTLSTDYMSVTLRSKPYTLTKPQSIIIKRLHEAEKTSNPALGSEYLLGLIEENYERLSDVFKVRGNSKLIRRVGKSTYRLNTSLPLKDTP